MFDFRGKAVLVTGAAQGFGRVCALAFAEQGAKVAICDINDHGGAETLRQIQAAGAEGLYVHADVAEEDEVAAFVSQTVATFGRLDIAVNNAAKEIAGPTLDLPSSDFDQLLDTNLKGTYYCMKHEVAQMRRNGGGSIVNQASVTSSLTGVPDNGLYGATKGGIIGLTKSAASRSPPRTSASAPSRRAASMFPTMSFCGGSRTTRSHAERRLAGSRSAASAARRRSPRRLCIWPPTKPASWSGRFW